MSYFLGIEVVQGDDVIFICQRRYCAELLKRFQMFDCNPVRIPVEVGTKLSREGDGAEVDPSYFKQIIESLKYLTWMRSDIAYGVSLISRYLEAPRQSHLQAILIVIGVEIMMIVKVLLAMFSIWHHRIFIVVEEAAYCYTLNL
ncbi:uncharacterized protein LOC109821080 [Asparagus officinalis]|uniref:uncharacterized protein LOC109821080 n=1 Tax=Asparagus officinalis TaxID=4686 RepID=UPI00098E76C1|nr:uncharacterized protein LOC109821080 [Asparagus officinalis]